MHEGADLAGHLRIEQPHVAFAFIFLKAAKQGRAARRLQFREQRHGALLGQLGEYRLLHVGGEALPHRHHGMHRLPGQQGAHLVGRHRLNAPRRLARVVEQEVQVEGGDRRFRARVHDSPSRCSTGSRPTISWIRVDTPNQ